MLFVLKFSRDIVKPQLVSVLVSANKVTVLQSCTNILLVIHCLEMYIPKHMHFILREE